MGMHRNNMTKTPPRQYLHCFHCEAALEDPKQWTLMAPTYDLSFSVCEDCRELILNEPEYIMAAMVGFPLLGQMLKDAEGGGWLLEEQDG